MKTKSIVIAMTLFSMASFSLALEEKHPSRQDVHAETDRHVEGSGEGFQLSETQAKTIGLVLVPIPTGSSFLVPKSAIVRSKDETGIYRFRNGWFKLILGRDTREGDRWRFAPLKAEDLKSGDQVAVEGVPLLRATDIYIFSAQEGEGE